MLPTIKYPGFCNLLTSVGNTIRQLVNVRAHIVTAVVAILLPFFLSPAVFAEDIPAKAKIYLPILIRVSADIWPEFKEVHIFAGQVEQETCISLKAKGCWNPTTQLKTDREWGFGLGQLTITDSMNMFEEVKKLSRGKLSSWKMEEWQDPEKQLMALVILDRSNYLRLKYPISNEHEKEAFMLSTYNGGSCLKDVKLCQTIKGCDPTKWFGNVELHSFKQKTKATGYGQSFFDINRSYVRNVLLIRSQKYKDYTK